MNGALGWSMLRKARAARSTALEADARHLFTDVGTSAGVVVGVIAVKLTGWLWLDPVVALAAALNICRERALPAWQSADGLTGEALEPRTQAQIRQVLDRFAQQPVRFDHAATRGAGQRRHVDLHMQMPADWTLGRAPDVRAAVERALMASVSGLRATLQLLPLDVEAQFDDPKDPTR